MSRLLDSTDGAPQETLGTCTFCYEEFPRSELSWSGGRYACPDCRAQRERLDEGRKLVAAPGKTVSAPAASPIAEVDRKVERAFGVGRFVGRWGSYGVACLIAAKYDSTSPILFGIVMADLGTWLSTAILDIKYHRWPILTEFAGFIVLTQLMLHTDLFEVPHSPADFGLAFFAFALFFTFKGTVAIVDRMHPDPE